MSALDPHALAEARRLVTAVRNGSVGVRPARQYLSRIPHALAYFDKMTGREVRVVFNDRETLTPEENAALRFLFEEVQREEMAAERAKERAREAHAARCGKCE